MKLVTVQEMRQLERAADTGGHSYAEMMERAGHAVAAEIERHKPGQRIVVLVGPGNNGGDGLVAARYLRQAKAEVTCYLWKPRAQDDPHLRRLVELDVPCLLADQDPDGSRLSELLQNADAIVDALLGTGASRPIAGKLEAILVCAQQAIRQRRPLEPQESMSAVLAGSGERFHQPLPHPWLVAVDVPTGLDCDTGAVDPVTLPADMTVTFAAPKRGQFRFPGATMVGELVVADIGIDPALGAEIRTTVATTARIRQALPARPMNAHKGTFGKAMIVAGSVNYTGAPYLAAEAAARVGTGLVTLAPPAPLHAILAAKMTEATFILLPHNMGVLTPDATKVLTSKIEGYAAMLLGPGLGQEKETVDFVQQLLGLSKSSAPRRIGFQPHQEPSVENAGLPPLVIDADGLNALSQAERWWTYLPENTILTPHPGEMARLIRADTPTVNQDRIAIAREKAGEWKQIVVLKGAFTVVAAPDGQVALVPFANPGLATAGTGDVLAGTIIGLLAQGLAPFDAALGGAYLHGLAGQIVAERVGNAGMLARDLLPVLPDALRRVKARVDGYDRAI
jgi:hydroxyethylthiazole kinase-like uncharacterized protein yjeF